MNNSNKTLTLKVTARRSGKNVDFGKEMVVAYRNGEKLPKVVEHGDQDSLETKTLKRIIKYMTQYHTRNRKSIFEVEEELTGDTYIHEIFVVNFIRILCSLLTE